MSQPPTSKANITVLMITKNEEKNLPHSIGSVIGWASRVCVIDSGSSDRTVEIARSLGAEVVHQDWLGYAKQKNWALDNLNIQTDWCLFLDADEAVMDDLKAELLGIAAKPVGTVEHSGFYINRYFIFLGKRIRHCGYYPSWNLRFFKRGRARYEEREVHEHMVVDGTTDYLTGHLEHDDRRGLEVYMDKHNKYSTLEAREIHRIRQQATSHQIDAKLIGAGPLSRRRWIKHHLYPKMPAKWLARFVFAYILQRGFLDGVTGFRFCLFLTAYELLIHLKLKEIELEERRAAESPTPASTRAAGGPGTAHPSTTGGTR
ncbi:MAG: glycosyltransferase family 2 protein [Phycisphaerales bacterium]